jgi:hypothetical protein
MNSKFFVAPIGDATRVVSMKVDPLFPGRKIIGRAQSFAAFTDLHSNKRKEWETVDKDGASKVTKIPLVLGGFATSVGDNMMVEWPSCPNMIRIMWAMLNTWRGLRFDPKALGVERSERLQPYARSHPADFM